MKKIFLFYKLLLCFFIAQSQISQRCPVCPPSLNGVTSGWVLTDSSGHAVWKVVSGGGSATWEQTLTNQGSTPFTVDHYVDMGNTNFNMNNAASIYTNSPYTGWYSNQANYNYTYWGDHEFQFLSDNNGEGLIMNTDNGGGYSWFRYSDIYVDQLHKVIYNGNDANWSHFITNSTGGNIVTDFGLVSQAGNGTGQGFVFRDNTGAVNFELNNNTRAANLYTTYLDSTTLENGATAKIKMGNINYDLGEPTGIDLDNGFTKVLLYDLRPAGKTSHWWAIGDDMHGAGQIVGDSTEIRFKVAGGAEGDAPMFVYHDSINMTGDSGITFRNWGLYNYGKIQLTDVFSLSSSLPISLNQNTNLEAGYRMKFISVDAPDADAGTIAANLYGNGLQIVGTSNDESYRKIQVYGEIQQISNDGTNILVGNNKINGQLQYTDGNEGANKVLTSDGSGNANWATIAASGNPFTSIFIDSVSTIGGSASLSAGASNIIVATGAITSATLALPSSPTDRDIVGITLSQTVGTLSFSGGTVVGVLTSSVPVGAIRLEYFSARNVWYQW